VQSDVVYLISVARMTWLLGQIPNLSRMAGRLSLAGMFLIMALGLTAVLRMVFRWMRRRREDSPVLMGAAIILMVIALVAYLAAIIVIKNI